MTAVTLNDIGQIAVPVTDIDRVVAVADLPAAHAALPRIALADTTK